MEPYKQLDSDQLKCVPVVDVHRDNLTQVWPSLMLSLETATFVALDIELSGLGNRKSLRANSVDERYTEISKSAKSRSILSLGISCFRMDVAKQLGGVVPCTVQTFDLILLCTADYVVESASLQFLVQHGFDFNKQYSKGIPYQPGKVEESEDDEEDTKPSLRLLFSKLMYGRKPLVIHNGLLDLVFLYHHFYAELPHKLSTFVADLYEMFPAGVYDTKYLAEFHLRHTSSYLEYVFRKLQLFNESLLTRHPTVDFHFLKYEAGLDCIDYRDMSISKVDSFTKADVCFQYANHGWCPNGIGCKLSHNVSAYLQMESEASKCKRVKNGEQAKENLSCTDDIDHSTIEFEAAVDTVATETNSNSSHRAGYDAFMTGYAMAVFLVTNAIDNGQSLLDAADMLSKESFTKDVANRICLAGKNQPLLIQKSSFSLTSKQHQTKRKKKRNTKYI